MPHEDDTFRFIIKGVEKAYTTARSLRSPNDQEISAAIARMPTQYQPAARRAAAATSKVSEWARKKYASYTTELVAPVEPTPKWNGRAPSPEMSSVSSCDGEGEIFPIKRRVSPASARRVEREMGEAMREGLAVPRPLGGYAEGMDPRRGRQGNRGRGRGRERRDSDAVVAQDVGGSRAWKREMTEQEKRRREEIEREWREREERCRYEEENDAIEDVGDNMFEPTMGQGKHSQKSDREELPMERSRRWEERSSLEAAPLELSSRGRQLEMDSNRVERLTRLMKERYILNDAEETTENRRRNALDRHELSNRRSESRQNDGKDNGFVNQPLRGRAMDEHMHLSARSGNCRRQISPENIVDLATAAAENFRQNNLPEGVEHPKEQENKSLEKKQSENKRPEKMLEKGNEKAEDSSSDDALQRPRRICSGPIFRKQDDEEEMPFAMPPISKSADK